MSAENSPEGAQGMDPAASQQKKPRYKFHCVMKDPGMDHVLDSEESSFVQ